MNAMALRARAFGLQSVKGGLHQAAESRPDSRLEELRDVAEYATGGGGVRGQLGAAGRVPLDGVGVDERWHRPLQRRSK
eukprot:1310506-Alexandrium_andersonii.AAC.1